MSLTLQGICTRHSVWIEPPCRRWVCFRADLIGPGHAVERWPGAATAGNVREQLPHPGLQRVQALPAQDCQRHALCTVLVPATAFLLGTNRSTIAILRGLLCNCLSLQLQDTRVGAPAMLDK